MEATVRREATMADSVYGVQGDAEVEMTTEN